MTPSPRRLGLLALLALLLIPGTGQAQPPDPASAQAYLEARQAAVREVMAQPEGEARDATLTRLLDDLLDYEEVAKRALRRHWNAHTEAERTEFVSLLRALVERGYRSQLSDTLRYRVEYTGAELQGDDVLVRSNARSTRNRRRPPIQIDYSLHLEGDAWRVHDVWTDGVSLVRNYRTQFSRIIREDGWDGLITRMRERVNAGTEAN